MSRYEALDFQRLTETEMIQRSRDHLSTMARRRSVRHFSTDPVPDEVIRNCLKTAGLAPNGANLQPWHFVVVRDSRTKKQIRAAAEEQEQAFYQLRAPAEWLEVLTPLGTDEHKPFLEQAPVLIAIFEQKYGLDADGIKRKHYYTSESMGIATGFLITALHQAGLATLTHTPSPMAFLSDLLNRPQNERAFLLLVTGYPAADAKVPVIHKKPLEEIVSFR